MFVTLNTVAKTFSFYIHFPWGACYLLVGILLLFVFFLVRPTEVEQSILEDLRNRVQLSSVALPSVSFYTFINTHNGYIFQLQKSSSLASHFVIVLNCWLTCQTNYRLNCSSISQDGSLVAGGFSDSSLKVSLLFCSFNKSHSYFLCIC